jgi:MoaA/NifB/PqqE/SkfB family radical SAM enzyme
VEISSFCNGECIYCPHTEYRENWESRLLPMELYLKIIPAFKKTELVHLQGWGEPFTHPDFTDFLRLAKEAGCMVGTTTNGTLIDSEKIRELVDEGLDIICFSIAGIDEKNDEIRKGTQIRKVLKRIEEIHRIKNNRSVDNPRVHMAYMLLRSGLDDVDKIPAFAKDAGVSQTVINSLFLPVNPTMEKESVLASDDEEYRELTNTFREIRNDAERRGTEISFNIVSHFTEKSICPENVGRALVVDSNGCISPCVMGQIPVEGKNDFYFKGNRRTIEKLSFGNICDETINTIWNKKGYKRFVRELFEGGTDYICRDCPKCFTFDLQSEDSSYLGSPIDLVRF